MMTFMAAILLCVLIIVGLYAFSWFGTPYSDSIRFIFYLFIVLFVLIVGFVFYDHPNEGYAPTVRVP